MRGMYLVLGFLSLGLGIIGVVLPLLPTTPFLLVTAFCFARSSEKFHNWLLSHPYFGKIIKDWRDHGAISKKSKISAMLVIILTILLSVVLRASKPILITQVIVLSMSTLFILTRPNGPKETGKQIE
ncbi:MAG: YbaN family protein [Pseudomonadota bacterium]